MYLHRDQTQLYVVTNADMFNNPSANDEDYQRYCQTALQQSISEDRRKAIETQLFMQLISEPVLQMIKLLKDHGADVNATVQKLEFYRKLDEHKKHLLVLHEQQGSVQAVQNTLMNDGQGVQIDTSGQTNAVKTRDEVIAEQKFERRQERRRRKGQKVEDPNDPKVWAKRQLKQFYAKQGYTPRYR